MLEELLSEIIENSGELVQSNDNMRISKDNSPFEYIINPISIIKIINCNPLFNDCLFNLNNNLNFPINNKGNEFKNI